MKRRLIKWGMALVLVLSTAMLSLTDISATGIDDAEVFLKQQTSSTCTLVSAAMALRRKAILQNDPNWASITEESLKNVAWSNGLKHNFSYSTPSYTYTISYGDIDDYGDAADITGDDKVNALAALLSQYPEGIVIYARNGYNGYTQRNHAVLLTSYTNGVFYVADPASYVATGIISIDQALRVTVENCASYWYVSSVTPVNATAEDNTAETTPTIVTDLSAGNVALSKSTYYYNGKKKKPTITVTYEGTTLTEGTDYSITYNGNMKSVGTHSITITGIGNYEGTLETSITIKPKKAKITSLSGKKKAMKVRYAKLKGNVTYQVAYKRSGKLNWSYTYTKSSSKTIKNLKSKTKYSVKVRGYRNGVYGSYSKTKTVKAK